MMCNCTGACKAPPFVCPVLGPQGGQPFTPPAPPWVQPGYALPPHPGPAYPLPPAPVASYGCICPPTSEQTCQGTFCPRKPFSLSAPGSP